MEYKRYNVLYIRVCTFYYCYNRNNIKWTIYVRIGVTKMKKKDVSVINSAAAIQCVPNGLNDKESVYSAVDKAIAAIDDSGLEYTVCPFETVIEGPLDRVYAAALAAHKALLESGVSSAASYIKLWSGESLGSSEEKTGKYRAKGH